MKDGSVYLPPLVIAELLSVKLSEKQRHSVVSFLSELKLCECGFDHWERVGELRMNILRRGIKISTPDAHIAQCALDIDCYFMSKDKIFQQIAKVVELNLIF